MVECNLPGLVELFHGHKLSSKFGLQSIKSVCCYKQFIEQVYWCISQKNLIIKKGKKERGKEEEEEEMR